MGNVQYTGPMDRYDLSAADWKKLGVEDGTKVSFERDEVYEIDDAALEAVLGLSGMKELSDAQAEKVLGGAPEGEDAGGVEGDSSSTSTSTGTPDTAEVTAGKTGSKTGSKASTKGSTT